MLVIVFYGFYFQYPCTYHMLYNIHVPYAMHTLLPFHMKQYASTICYTLLPFHMKWALYSIHDMHTVVYMPISVTLCGGFNVIFPTHMHIM